MTKNNSNNNRLKINMLRKLNCLSSFASKGRRIWILRLRNVVIVTRQVEDSLHVSVDDFGGPRRFGSLLFIVVVAALDGTDGLEGTHAGCHTMVCLREQFMHVDLKAWGKRSKQKAKLY